MTPSGGSGGFRNQRHLAATGLPGTFRWHSLLYPSRYNTHDLAPESTKERIRRDEYLEHIDKVDDRLLDIHSELYALKGAHDIKDTVEELIESLKDG